MTLSQYSATTIVPLLARIVLFFAFIWAGSAKLFGEPVTFDGRDAWILQQLEVGRPAGDRTVYDDQDSPSLALVSISRAAPPQSLRSSRTQDDPPDESTPERDGAAADNSQDDAGADDADQESEAEDEAVDETAPPADESGDVPAVDIAQQTAPARVAAPVHNITVMLVKGGWDINWKPHWMAWLAGLTEFAGAILLLIGLFSRFWAMGLCIAMGFAFYLTSIPMLQEVMYFNLSSGQFNMLFSQVGLFILAFTVLVSGPGPLSLDRAIFRRPHVDELDEAV